MVGASGFEPETSCAQGNSRNAKLLVRLAFSYVMHYGFAGYLPLFVPKLFPMSGMNPCYETKNWALFQFRQPPISQTGYIAQDYIPP